MQTEPPHQYRRSPNPSPLTRLTSAIAICVVGTVWTGCTEDGIGTGPTMPSIGTLVIEVSTSGQDVDSDGYLVLVDGSSSRSIEVNGSVTLSDLSTGDHVVALTGVAENCTVGGVNPRTLTLASGEMAQSAFEVNCIAVVTTSLMDQIVFWTNRDGNAEIYVMNTDGSRIVNLTRAPSFDSEPAISPDGKRVLFVTARDGNREIYVMNHDGSSPENLTNHPANDERPRWSPDGSKIAFTSDRSGAFNIFVMNADGSDPINVTNAQANGATWSPDGTRIAFTSNRTGDFEIFVMDSDGSNPVNLTNDPGRSDFAPAWSPDGTRIAFTRNEGFEEGALGPGEIFVMNADGSNRLNLTNDPANDINPSWSRDGSRMAFASNRTGDFEVFAMEADGSMPINLSNTTGAADLPGFPQAWSP